MILHENLSDRCIDAKAAAGILQNILAAESPEDQNKEHLWVIGCNNNLNIMYVELVSLGTVNETYMIPRDVLRTAITKGAIRILIAHNHPSGSLTPSDQDTRIGKQLVQAAKLMGISVIDFIIITPNDFWSGKEADNGFIWE